MKKAIWFMSLVVLVLFSISCFIPSGIYFDMQSWIICYRVSVLDLYSTTWNINSSKVVGVFEGKIVRENQFEVWCWDDKEIKLEELCGSRVISYCKMDGRMLEKDSNENYYLKSVYGMLKILDEEGNVVATIR